VYFHPFVEKEAHDLRLKISQEKLFDMVFRVVMHFSFLGGRWVVFTYKIMYYVTTQNVTADIFTALRTSSQFQSWFA
jgi:hypothetical protein